MISVPCDLCGSDSNRRLGVGKRFNIEAPVVVCLGCGLAFQNPRMTEHELADFYRDKYRDVYSGNNAEPTQDFVAAQREHGQKVLKRISHYFTTQATVLDVGCGPGGMLLPFRDAGHSVIGIEPGRYAAWGRERLGIDIREVAFESADLDVVRPDAILLSFVLEHVSSPARLLRHAHDILQSGGILYVEVPNLWSIRGPVSKYFHVAHLTYFTPPTLVGMLQACGFQELEVIAGNAYGLTVVARRSSPRDVRMPVEDPSAVVSLLQRHARITAAQEFVKSLLKPAGSAVSVAARLVAGPEGERKLHAHARKVWARARYGD